MLVAQSGMGEIMAADISPLAADGSERIFYRLATNPGTIAIFPSPADHGLAEAASCYTIGCHLADVGVPVPQVFGQYRPYRVVLLEDVGDQHLYDIVLAKKDFALVRSLYYQALEALVALQIKGRQGFDLRCCWGSRYYNFEVMIQQEALYFLNSLCRDYLAIQVDLSLVEADMVAIARQAAREPADFLLHRDFQSRNLMVKDGNIHIIDFQGARLGPLGYDLASLLIDPYTNLTLADQQELLAYYLELVAQQLDIDSQSFQRGYYYLAIQRNLQILGAFAFLSQQKGKVFFDQFITPALQSLLRLLARVEGNYHGLAELVDNCLNVHIEAGYLDSSLNL